ncbi:MAG TPA: carbon storage regulator CsrA [Candidatus Acidoferrum sp.]|nr:carbon storage regulator CsrA [Candidatus Acidoferrum sp.]
MLILSRKVNESIIIDGRIIVRIMRVDGEVVKVGIEAPKEMPVHRQEVYEEIQKNNQEALATNRAALPQLARVLRAETVTTAQQHSTEKITH